MVTYFKSRKIDADYRIPSSATILCSSFPKRCLTILSFDDFEEIICWGPFKLVFIFSLAVFSLLIYYFFASNFTVLHNSLKFVRNMIEWDILCLLKWWRRCLAPNHWFWRPKSNGAKKTRYLQKTLFGHHFMLHPQIFFFDKVGIFFSSALIPCWLFDIFCLKRHCTCSTICGQTKCSLCSESPKELTNCTVWNWRPTTAHPADIYNSCKICLSDTFYAKNVNFLLENA